MVWGRFLSNSATYQSENGCFCIGFSIYFEQRPKLESSTSDPLWGTILDQHLAKMVMKMGTKNGPKTTPEFAMASAPFLVTFGHPKWLLKLLWGH